MWRYNHTVDSNNIMHAKKGGYKYIKREFKNGKWRYYYKPTGSNKKSYQSDSYMEVYTSKKKIDPSKLPDLDPTTYRSKNYKSTTTTNKDRAKASKAASHNGPIKKETVSRGKSFVDKLFKKFISK